MKLHIEVPSERRFEIQQNIGKFMLMFGKTICIIQSADFTEEDVVIKGGWFSEDKTVKKIFLTEMEICAYNPDAKRTGTFSAEDNYVTFIMFTNFYAARQRWNDFKEMLKQFHCEIVPIKENPEQDAIDEENRVQTKLEEIKKLMASLGYKVTIEKSKPIDK